MSLSRPFLLLLATTLATLATACRAEADGTTPDATQPPEPPAPTVPPPGPMGPGIATQGVHVLDIAIALDAVLDSDAELAVAHPGALLVCLKAAALSQGAPVVGYPLPEIPMQGLPTFEQLVEGWTQAWTVYAPEVPPTPAHAEVFARKLFDILSARFTPPTAPAV